MLEEHKKLLLEKYYSSPKGWMAWLLKTKSNQVIIEELKQDYPLLTSLNEMVYWLVNDLKDFPKCEYCKTNIPQFVDTRKGYKRFCCCRCAQLDPSTQQKQKQTNFEKYGDYNYNNLQKRKETCLQKYGVDNPFKSEDIKQKIKQTSIQKYGVENAHQSKLIIDKQKKTLLTKYGVNCGFKCAKEFNKSKGELELFDFIYSIYNDAISGDRTVIQPLELDIYIPTLHLAIEYDGDYWHSLPNMRKRDSLKNYWCKQNNIHLIRVLESEWLDNKENIKQKLIKELKNYE